MSFKYTHRYIIYIIFKVTKSIPSYSLFIAGVNFNTDYSDNLWSRSHTVTRQNQHSLSRVAMQQHILENILRTMYCQLIAMCKR